jgi:hypothetical protein
MKSAIRLSKSRIIEGISCDKKVYLSVHQRDLKAPVSEAQQTIFDQGNAVGLLARTYFPNGTEIKAEYWDTKLGAVQTQAAIDGGRNTIYEATFDNGTLHCRVDILHRKTSRDAWTLIEVKSGASAKDEYLLDVAIQAVILKEAGIKVGAIKLMYLNTDCVYPDLSNLFTVDDVTKAIKVPTAQLPAQVKKILKILGSKKTPEVAIGRHCTAPYECDFKEHCWSHIPNYSVFDLPLSWKLFELGYLGIHDIEKAKLAPSQKRAYQVAVSGKRYVDSKGIKSALLKWKPPFYHLDFETLGPAIPRFEGTRPYENVPIQFSLDVQESLGSSVRHFEYLHPDSSDPREQIANHLVKWIPAKGGSVVSYNSSFEAGVLKKLSDRYPKLRRHLLSIAARLVDPHPVIKAHVYDKEFRGSFSIKSVAPALLGDRWSYDRLSVPDGTAAQRAYEEMIAVKTPNDRRQELRKHLLQYCAQDTMAMVELLNWMRKQVS